MPTLVHDYLVAGRGRFAFFPCGAYLAFGIATGMVLRRTPPDRLERVMQWGVAGGLGLVLGGQYFSNIPYSLYTHSDFWLDSPGLVIIRCGLSLALPGRGIPLDGVCGRARAGAGWRAWGRRRCWSTGSTCFWFTAVLAAPWKARLPIPWTFAATVFVMALMVGLSAARLRYAARRTLPARAKAAGASSMMLTFRICLVLAAAAGLAARANGAAARPCARCSGAGNTPSPP